MPRNRSEKATAAAANEASKVRVTLKERWETQAGVRREGAWSHFPDGLIDEVRDYDVTVSIQDIEYLQSRLVDEGYPIYGACAVVRMLGLLRMACQEAFGTDHIREIIDFVGINALTHERASIRWHAANYWGPRAVQRGTADG